MAESKGMVDVPGRPDEGLSGERLIEVYQLMLTVRRWAEQGEQLFAAGKVSSFFHSCVGQEAVGIGVGLAMGARDLLLSYHRAHAYGITRGTPLEQYTAEILSKRTGVCQGRGGEAHICDVSRGNFGGTGIVGSYLVVAPGLAYAQKVLGTQAVVVCAFGEGSACEGEFHEGLNLASIWKVPVVFILENNGWQVTMPNSRAIAVQDYACRAAGYGMPGIVVDGMDVVAVYETVKAAIERARAGGGPSFLECQTYRFKGHSRGDPPYGVYRTKEEVEAWYARDPLKALGAKLSLAEEDLARLDEEARATADRAYQYALASPLPAGEEAETLLYA